MAPLKQGVGSTLKNKDPPPSPWRKSRAKDRLRELLTDESSWIHALSADAEQIHQSDPLFKRYPLKNFKTNFKNMKEAIKVEKSAIAFDQRALEQEKQAFARNPITERGYYFWDRHPAQQLMAEDVKAGRTFDKKPRDLQRERPEFQEFPLSVFRGHKYQEERKVKEGVYWQKKRNDTARKKHFEDVQIIGGGGGRVGTNAVN
jgi:hypothetical protein